jgi:hypothetical protein
MWVGTVVVMLTDMLMSGASVGGSIVMGVKDAVTKLMETVRVSTAGELGLCMLWMLTAECAEAVLDPSDESPKSNALGV